MGICRADLARVCGEALITRRCTWRVFNRNKEPLTLSGPLSTRSGSISHRKRLEMSIAVVRIMTLFISFDAL
jgi:hypothetical protein